MIMAELFYVIGASGVGKDSLLGYARNQLPADAPVVFVHRYITRPQEAGGENHVALSEQEFRVRMSRGCFAMQWYSHQTWYGIGIEINQWLAKGLNVVLNGSRGHLDEAAQKYPELIPVLISVSPDTLRKRLLMRARETPEQIEERLATAVRLDVRTSHPRLVRIENEGELGAAGSRLLSLIQGAKPQACA
jgi:ribose 1,5-bisphosphokinase